MRRTRFAAVIAAIAACASFASAADLNVGDKAPPLKVGKWIKGEPVEKLDPSKTYVVEFWATWCGPCKQTIPHLSEMQGKYKDVVFIGQDVWERDVEQAKSEAFVAEMGDKMSYRVATDDRSAGGKGAMAETWMEAAGQDGIPTAFIVKDGTVAWIGHPMEMEPVLEKVVAGKFDAEAAKKATAEKAAQQDEMVAVGQEFQDKVIKPLRAGDAASASAAVDALVAAHPAMKKQVLHAAFVVFIKAEQNAPAYKAADELAAAANDDPQALNELAWTIVDDASVTDRDYDRAEKYATRAVELTNSKRADILDTLARVYAEKGQMDKALEWQTKAVENAPAELKEELQKTLDEYKTKAK
jgi:thiol-disulfide isomerase/thioredoxin